MMSKTIESRAGAQAWHNKHNPLAPKIGTEAPDFELIDVSGTSAVRLSDFRSKRPVALIFGSFT